MYCSTQEYGQYFISVNGVKSLKVRLKKDCDFLIQKAR